jgi:hypothetical protein
MRYKVCMAVMGGFFALVTVNPERLGALLTGYEESPSVSTTGTGEFSATIESDDAISYRETFRGLQGSVTQSHIHVGQLGVNGSIVIFLCQTPANPDPTNLSPQCPPDGGTVSGTITPANVIAGATAAQQLKANDLTAVIAAIRAGAAYANVHTNLSPGGEIRGQIRIIAK